MALSSKKCAIVGVGAFGSVYAEHKRRLMEGGVDTAKLVALVDLNPENRYILSLKPLLDERRIWVYDDYKQMLRREKPDFVYVVTSTPDHFEAVRFALEAGAHVLCEKPLADSLGSAEELVKMQKRRQRKGKRNALCVGQVLRYFDGNLLRAVHSYPEYPFKPFHAEVTFEQNWFREGKRRNVLEDKLVHAVDLLNFLVNPRSARVSCHISGIEPEGMKGASYKHALVSMEMGGTSCASASIRASFGHFADTRELVFFCYDGGRGLPYAYHITFQKRGAEREMLRIVNQRTGDVIAEKEMGRPKRKLEWLIRDFERGAGRAAAAMQLCTPGQALFNTRVMHFAGLSASRCRSALIPVEQPGANANFLNL